ncbi:MAG TPA: hypothetical protein PK431_00945 [Chitinophagales bacterium]|nr:hypothetical protein [Chitinophagales bacterium]
MKKISRKKCLELYSFPQSDEINETYFYPKQIAHYVLELNVTSVSTYLKLLNKNLTKLLTQLEIEELIFLGETKTPWLSQQNSYKPVKEAIGFFEQNNIGNKFNGAIVVKTNSLYIFVKHLFWLTRCNAAFPLVYGTNDKQQLLIHLCKYGNLHIDILDKNIKSSFEKLLKTTDFIILKNRICSEHFGKSRAIIGREIRI